MGDAGKHTSPTARTDPISTEAKLIGIDSQLLPMPMLEGPAILPMVMTQELVDQMIQNYASYEKLRDDIINTEIEKQRQAAAPVTMQLEEEAIPSAKPAAMPGINSSKEFVASKTYENVDSEVKYEGAPFKRTSTTQPDVIPFEFHNPSPCNLNMGARQGVPFHTHSDMSTPEHSMEMSVDEEP